MNRWQTGRAGIAILAGISMALAAACSKGDNTAADTSAMGGMMDTTNAAMAPAAGGMTDEQIITQVSAVNGEEIAAATLAKDKATSSDVKDFAQMMITDHQKMQGQVDSLATALNITPTPPQNDTLAQHATQMSDSLKSMAKGAAWDRSYMDMQVTGHENALDLLNRAQTATQNAQLKQLLQTATPIVQQHLDRARQIVGGMGT